MTTLPTDEAERLAQSIGYLSSGVARDTAAALRSLSAERDALLLKNAEAIVSVNKVHADRMQAEREARKAEAERDALAAECARMRGALTQYADWFCEHSTSFEGCGKLHHDDCSGCLARAALGARAS